MPFDYRLLNNSNAIAITDIYGAANRRTMLWGQRVLVNSAQFSFVEYNRQAISSWSSFAGRGVAGVQKLDVLEQDLIPGAQIRLMSALQTFAQSGAYDGPDSKHKEFGRLLDLRRFFEGLSYKAPAPERRPPTGSRVDERVIWTATILQGAKTPVRSGAGDAWKAWPVMLPASPFVSSMNEIAAPPDGRSGRSDYGPFDVGLVVERQDYALDEAAVKRFTRAMEHFTAHVALLQHVRRVVHYWWAAVFNPPSWEAKETACGNFLRSLEQHSLNITPLWALGANDVQVDPEIIAALDDATRLTNAWTEANTRLADLTRFAAFVLKREPAEIYLGRRTIGLEDRLTQ